MHCYSRSYQVESKKLVVWEPNGMQQIRDQDQDLATFLACLARSETPRDFSQRRGDEFSFKRLYLENSTFTWFRCNIASGIKMKRTSRLSSNFTLSPTKRLSMLGPDSPISRRQSIADTSARNENVFLDVPENNDEKEKKQRQLNRLQQQIQSKTFSPTATTSDHRKSISIVSGLTNQQLTEHYSKCIQLSTENKINVNNAFKLQLIDYMSEMLHRRDSEMENFQVASCTLDASAKIYAYRVDSVHTDALKMAGGLGSSKGEKSKEAGEEMDCQDENEGRKEKKKKKRKKVIIESNMKNINVKGFDLDFQVDPLFKKMAAQFDEGRSKCGPFLTSLQFLDDSCSFVLDSETVLLNSGKVKEEQANSPLVSVPRVADMKGKRICPTFAPFEFTTWKLGDEDSFCDISRLRDTDDEDEDPEAVDEHKFDVNAVPEPICDMDFDNNFYDDGMDSEEGDTVVTVGQGGCQKMPPPLMEAVHLKDHLATIPSEYSYFDSHRMCAWAGPTHWKIRPLSKTKLGETKNDKKRKKELIKLTYRDDENNISKLFAVDRKTTKLSQATLKTWTKEKTTMPVDLHYEARNFLKLFGRPTVVIQRQRKAAAVDESINEYNYDNQNDRENFCAQDDNVSGYGDSSTPGYDMTDIFSETAVGSQPTNDLENKASDFLGNLVAAPDKIEKVNIGYARTAKKVDMKKLKTAIWDMLADPSTEKENCRQSENQAENNKKDKMDSNCDIEFSSMYKALPQRLSVSMSGNISVPLVFIGLLHLANEHNLKLVDKGNLMDFTVMQG
ncbi:condensin complex subunit 2-like [Scylla paramamosain]|uniref:condensin complex subunit 2-like n=1 Tax=Scylla paramamosain TaxID=85552 RepID=UPI0030837311